MCISLSFFFNGIRDHWCYGAVLTFHSSICTNFTYVLHICMEKYVRKFAQCLFCKLLTFQVRSIWPWVTLKFEPEILRQNQPPGKYKTGNFLRYFGFGRTFTMSCCDKWVWGKLLWTVCCKWWNDRSRMSHFWQFVEFVENFSFCLCLHIVRTSHGHEGGGIDAQRINF